VAGSHNGIHEAYYHQVSSHDCCLSLGGKDSSLRVLLYIKHTFHHLMIISLFCVHWCTYLEV